MRARPERYGAVQSGVKGPLISDMTSQLPPRSKARHIVNSVCSGKAAQRSPGCCPWEPV